MLKSMFKSIYVLPFCVPALLAVHLSAPRLRFRLEI